MAETDSLATLIARHADHPALADRERSLTWGQVNAHSIEIAAQLQAQGVSDGDRVAVIEPNRCELPLLLLGLFRIGAVAVLLSRRLPRSALAEQAAGVVAQSLAVFDGERSSIPELPTVVASADNEATSGHAIVEPTTVSPNHPATITFTSGSAAEPKAVLQSYGNHIFNALGSNENIPLHPGDRWLLSLPLYHVGGLGILFRCMLGGAAIVLPDDKIDLAEQVIRDQITHLSLVPTQLRRLMKSNCTSEAAGSLNAILLGGAPIPSGMLDEARELGFPVYPTYGLTEMASQVATANRTRPNCMKVLPYRELRIADDHEILVKGKTLFRGYVEDRAAICSVDNDGWFHTGDLGQIDDNGCLTVLGRKDNMFISGGENIQPEQIEKALVDIDGIEEALVVPVEDAEFGHRPVAFLKCRPETSLSEYESDLPEEEKFQYDHDSIRRQLARTMPRFMLPIAFYPWPQSYQQSGLKASRSFFAALAVKLYRTRR